MYGKTITQKTEQKASDEWIDRYVNEVGRRLPANQRSDVEREIRSLIEDAVAGRFETLEVEGVPLAERETVVLAVLQAFGSPEEIAARYHAPRYLIGPTIFPIYRIVLSIVLAVTVFANLLGVVVAADEQMAAPLVETLLSLFGSIIQTVGMVTLLFVALERLGVAAESRPQPWNPTSLPAVKDPQRVNLVETAIDIGFTAAVIVLLNVYLNRRTGALFYNGEWQTMPLFSQEFLQYIPWLTAIWCADILVNIILLTRGRWEPFTRIATMITATAAAILFYSMISSGPIGAWPPVEPAFKVTAAIIFAVSLVEVGKQGWLLLRSSNWIGDRLHSQQVL